MGRSPCCENGHINKGAWTKEEDQRLISYIRVHGEGCWRTLPKAAGLLRCGKSCRLRWVNYLRPDVKRGNFSEEEDEIIMKLHHILGNKWSIIAGRLPGRTDNEIKNYWNTHIKRKLLSRGIDPQNHRPPVAAPAAAPAPVPVAPKDITAVVASTASLAEEIVSSTTSTVEEEERSLNINLNLPITLPDPSSSPTAATGSPSTSSTTTSASTFDDQQAIITPSPSPPATQLLCFCYHLGFRRGEPCGCQTTHTPHALRYHMPFQGEQRRE